MRLTVLGGGGVFPVADGACGGFLVEQDGFRLLLDPGFAVLPRLLRHLRAGEVDAVYVTHGHPDHCADLNPLLRARALSGEPAPPLPVYAPDGAVAGVLALDRAELMACEVLPVHERFHIGPFAAEVRMLPHSVPNAGVRLSAGGEVLAYTGDSGPCSDVVALARDADTVIAEATFLDEVPKGVQLSSARFAGRQCAAAGAGRLLLTHLQPGTDPAASVAIAGEEFDGEIAVAAPA